MPRQRIRHRRKPCAFPEDFPERLKRLKQESGLPRPEIARRLGNYPHAIWGWTSGSMRPNTQHMRGILAQAESFALGLLLAASALTVKRYLADLGDRRAHQAGRSPLKKAQ